MIDKIYKCDLCREAKDHRSPSWRLKWVFSGVELMPLADNSASEQVICKQCLAGLVTSNEGRKLCN